jgi:uncharacterized membrane protein YphA (DoxX/SURF4 family)
MMGQDVISTQADPKGWSAAQMWLLVGLRTVIGWHFLYEGIAKLFTPGWTSAEFLGLSRWAFAGMFRWIAETPAALAVVDALNIWGLILIGAGLMLGCFARAASVAGVVLLALYYVANPPLVGLDYGVPMEGNYLIVNKNLVELAALLLLAFVPASQFLGLDRLLARWKEADADPQVPDRRELLRGFATLPVAGAFGVALFQKGRWESYEEKNLVDATATASAKPFDFATLKKLKGQIPKAKIQGVEFSRLILGGNLLSGWAHSRDLIYVSQLVKAYHHKDKIFATLLLAEKCGVNTLLTNPILCTIIEEYWKRGIGKIQFISDCAGLNYTDKGASPMPFGEYLDRVKRAIDYGAVACYIQGETADYYMSHGQADQLAKVLDLIRQRKVIVGIGAHEIDTVKACVEAGFQPDFWMKTLHHHGYWSAKHPEWHDNMFCTKLDETIAYMKELPQPWIAFKTMAAGAILPKDGFRFAFENGADFVCAGMYDFQMVDDANVALEILASDLTRERPWRA